MTDGITLGDLAAACAQIEVLCAKVGLMRNETLPTVVNMSSTPDGTCIWSSTYAQLLFWPCLGADGTSFEQGARDGQAWFDEVLTQSERFSRGRPIDGYLVLALPKAPQGKAREDMRHLELSAQVCRKHLIWPSLSSDADYEPGIWKRIADVTVLGLPDTDFAPGAELQWPELDDEAEALWARISEQGVGPTVLQDEVS